MTLFQDCSYNKSFFQLAKESSFTFNLYRGRVDWKKLEVLDVDRIVRDQDVELLNIHINSVTNCNLESEYDVKILDPNFIKLFKLAQLLIDFLLHCKRYLEHCIKVAHESLQASNKEVEILRKQLQARKTEVKQLKKKVKEVKQQLLHTPRLSSPTYECSLCGKLFMNEKYLQGHHSRRHIVHSCPMALKPLNLPPSPPTKVSVQEENEKLQKPEDITSMKKKYQEEIEEMKSMFFAEIEKLKQNGAFDNPIIKTNNEENNSKITNSTPNENHQEPKRTDFVAEASKKPTQPKEEINKILEISSKMNKESSSGLKQPNVTEDETNKIVESRSENNKGKSSKTTDLVEHKQADNGASLEKEAEEAWLQRLEEREGVWRTRLSVLDQQHKKQVHVLQDKLQSSQLEGQEMKKDLERRLEEVLSKFEKSQALFIESKNHSLNKEHHNQKDNFVEELNSTETPKKSQIRIQSLDNRPEKSLKQPPPFQKRKAFVSQKTKTIQDEDSFETPDSKDAAYNLVKVLQPDDESDFEGVPPRMQDVTNERSDYRMELGEKKTPPVVQPKDKNPEVTSRSKNKENIITKLLEEEKWKNMANKKQESGPTLVVEDESSITETLTETESETESSEEKQEVRREGSEDQLLRTETALAQQSLKSMESLLAANPTILHQLREDLQQLLGRRLQQLGVDPGWGCLPPTTFQNKMSVLTHQRQITAKNHKVYYTLRDKLSQDADAAVHSRPTQSTAESVLARLRRKAAQVITAGKFTRQLGTIRKQDTISKPQSHQANQPQAKPLASSSPHSSPQPSVQSPGYQDGRAFVIPKIQSTSPKDSLSLSSSTYEDDEEEVEVKGTSVNVTYTKPKESYKSALRNAVSTGNLAKKKVLFVDEALTDQKRALSEQTVASADSFSTGQTSVASLVQEIQLQLSQRARKPAHSVDLMTQPDARVDPASSPRLEETLELPLAQILPLSKSGRELLESQQSSTKKPPAVLSRNSLASEKTSPRTLEPLSHILKKVPLSKPNASTTLPVTSINIRTSAAKNLLQPPKLSPTLSLTSIGSSLMDVSGSPRGTPGSLEWDLQDLEDNLKE